jgi:hypothetical protein
VQPADAVGAVLLVEMNDDLGVTVRREVVAAAHEILAQLTEVVDLAVEHDRDRAVLVVNRLVPGDEVDDAQPLDPEPDFTSAEDAARIWPAVLEAGAHPLDHVGPHRGSGARL